MTSRPLVVAHRGASAAYAEHTIEAYEVAIAEGADAFECDVRLTADGHLVCVHDATIERTSNGRGSVGSMTLEQLRRWDFSSWKSGCAASALGEVEPRRSVLTLDSLLELATSAGVGMSIETKHPTTRSFELEAALAAALKHFGLVPPGRRPDAVDAPVRMMSFSAAALGRMRDVAPSIPTVHLVETAQRVARDGRLPGGAVISGPGLHLVRADPDLVARAHDAGHPVHVWTVNEPVDVDLCLNLGVDALISNFPGRTAVRVSEWGREPGR